MDEWINEWMSGLVNAGLIVEEPWVNIYEWINVEGNEWIDKLINSCTNEWICNKWKNKLINI